MASVYLTKGALEDIKHIGSYIARESGNQRTALSFLDKISETCQLHAEQPLLGEARPDLGSTIRMLLIGSYVGFYRPLDNGIELLLITHGARDVPNLFRKRLMDSKKK